ncbi:hypothetical protein O181_051145 [Austropuccinia psidii MF-1]|uniref:Uncharacterized protein n=1 Tax=Austropuccinia psidii MF-1 TaxID=1389203 RepID=A0A9Q3E2G5_9BASI|nr:hypothetical protein [Austropuccinia psidii MF-1]
MSASRQRQSSHVSHENVTQSANPFQHYLQRLGNFTSLASASPMLRMLTRPHRPPDETPTLPPHLLTHSHPRPYHPYACVVPSQHAFDTAYHPYARGVPSQHAPNTAYHPYACGVPPHPAYHPYACGVPSQHAPDTTYPYACVVPSQHCLPSLCFGVPSQHAPNTAYHPWARGVPS